MKKIASLMISLVLLKPVSLVLAQDITNAAIVQTPAYNPDFVIDVKGNILELIPNRRAHTTKKHDQLNRATASNDDLFTASSLGVLINHSTGVELATTGEITFKLKSGVSADTLQTLALPNTVLVMKPDIYVVKTSTPRQMVIIARKLNTSSIIEWAEPYTILANIN